MNDEYKYIKSEMEDETLSNTTKDTLKRLDNSMQEMEKIIPADFVLDTRGIYGHNTLNRIDIVEKEGGQSHFLWDVELVGLEKQVDAIIEGDRQRRKFKDIIEME